MKRNRQTGMVGVEVALLVVAVAVFGFVYYRVYMTKTKTPAAVTKVSNTTPDGSVDHAVNAVTESSAKESAVSQDSTEANQVTGIASDASNVQGSFNENDF